MVIIAAAFRRKYMFACTDEPAKYGPALGLGPWNSAMLEYVHVVISSGAGSRCCRRKLKGIHTCIQSS